LIVEPYLGCAVLATQVLLAAATDAPSTAWLPSLCDGSRRLALAYSESASRGMPHYVATRAERDGTGYRLHGHKTLVLGAPGADGYIVSARTSGEARDAEGISLFIVAAGDERLKVAPVMLHDGRAAAELTLDGVRVAHPLGDLNRGLPALQEGLAHAVLALGAELVGAMERTIEVTADYLRSRKQFGVPIATFQSLQHRMADMAAELELARSMLFAALASFQNDDVPTRLEMLSAAKALITRAARNVCGQAIQLHGGIGLTEEYVVGHFFKRAVVGDTLFGSSTLHEAACAEALRTRLGTGPAANRPARNLRAV
jgi:alkylation response protein AidB-like acyl-CoA dehydrogenase